MSSFPVLVRTSSSTGETRGEVGEWRRPQPSLGDDCGVGAHGATGPATRPGVDRTPEQ